MQKIAIIGQFQHELQSSQLQQLADTIRADIGSECIVFTNASGMFSNSSKLNEQVEQLLGCGMDQIFLGEQALQRAAGRRALDNFASKLVRPLNISELAPAKGAKLFEAGHFKAWLLSIVDHSGRIYAEPPHLYLETFFKNKSDRYPVFINFNGTNLPHKTALPWWLREKGYEALVFGSGLGYQLCDSTLVNQATVPFILDIGSVVVENTIDGLTPKAWWEWHVERKTSEFLPEWGRLKCDYIVFSLDNNKKIQNCLHKSIKI